MLIPNEIFFAQVDDLLEAGESVQLTVKGYSMRPLLRNERNMVVLRSPAQHDALQVGDVVLFRYHGRHILHRIVAIDGDRLTIAGDGLYLQQEHCLTRDVVGVVEMVIRKKNGRIIRTDSTYWKRMSRLWLSLPPLLRRYILSILFHLGWK